MPFFQLHHIYFEAFRIPEDKFNCSHRNDTKLFSLDNSWIRKVPLSSPAESWEQEKSNKILSYFRGYSSQELPVDLDRLMCFHLNLACFMPCRTENSLGDWQYILLFIFLRLWTTWSIIQIAFYVFNGLLL